MSNMVYCKGINCAIRESCRRYTDEVEDKHEYQQMLCCDEETRDGYIKTK